MKICFAKFFARNISETVTDHIKFFFHLELYQKNQVHGSHHAQSNIFHKSVIIQLAYGT